MGCALRFLMAYTIFPKCNKFPFISLHLLQQNKGKSMCLVKPVDFATALNISYGTIRSKITRGQLLRNKNKLIDTENITNYQYLLEVNGGDQSVFAPYDLKPVGRTKVQKKVTLASVNEKKVTTPKKVVEKIVEKPKITENSDFEKPSNNKGSVRVASAVETKKNEPEKLSPEERKELREAKKKRETLYDIELRKKQADLDLQERTAEIKKMQLEKIAGNTLPLDLTKKILQINCQAILIQFLAQVENMVAITVEEFGGTRADNVRITTELKKHFKKTVETCETAANREIEIAVAEYSEVRSRGERK